MTKINLKGFNKTPVVQKLEKSKSEEDLKAIDEEPKPQKTRGRKSKYATEDERKEVRRKQQREYRLRKKEEIERLKEKVAALEGIEKDQ